MELSCRKVNCPMSSNRICLQKNVVYEIKCSKCSSIYIGSTIREFHTRMTEHGKDENSSVFKHLLTCLPNHSVFRSTVALILVGPLRFLSISTESNVLMNYTFQGTFNTTPCMCSIVDVQITNVIQILLNKFYFVVAQIIWATSVIR